MKMEKLFPISINPQFCVWCEKCSYSCSTKALFFRDTFRYVDYNKCKGCLKCVSVYTLNAFKLDELCCKIEHTITPEISDALENLSLKVIQENI